MRGRTLLVVALLGAALCAERFAYYAMRSTLMLELARSEGMDPARRGFVLGLISLVIVIGTFVGAGASYAVGPRVTAVAAAALGILGHLLSAAHVTIPAALLIGFAGGVLRVCPYAVAAEATDDAIVPGGPPSPRRFVILTAFAFATLFGSTFAANTSSAFAGEAYHRGGFLVVAVANVVVMFIATSLAAVALLVGRKTADTTNALAAPPYRAAEAMPHAPPSPPQAKWLGLVAVVLVAGVVAFGNVAANPTMLVTVLGTSTADIGKMFTLSSGADGFSSLVGAIVFIALAATGSSVIPLRFLGAGAVATGLGLLLFGAAIPGGSTALFTSGLVLGGLADPWVNAPLYAYAALCFRGRAAGVGVAAMAAVFNITNALATPIVNLPVLPHATWPLLAAVAAIPVGLAALVMGPRLQRALFD